jgi:hypothetical protein
LDGEMGRIRVETLRLKSLKLRVARLHMDTIKAQIDRNAKGGSLEVGAFMRRDGPGADAGDS